MDRILSTVSLAAVKIDVDKAVEIAFLLGDECQRAKAQYNVLKATGGLCVPEPRTTRGTLLSLPVEEIDQAIFSR